MRFLLVLILVLEERLSLKNFLKKFRPKRNIGRQYNAAFKNSSSEQDQPRLES